MTRFLVALLRNRYAWILGRYLSRLSTRFVQRPIGSDASSENVGLGIAWTEVLLTLVVLLFPSSALAIEIIAGTGSGKIALSKSYDFGDGPTQISKMIMAGDPDHPQSDSPVHRVDANLSSSPFRGVGSLRIIGESDVFICSGTTVTLRHLVTAAHCFDFDDNGTIDVLPGDVTYYLNDGSEKSAVRSASDIVFHPQFTGFANPRVNDDVAVVTLASALPTGSKTYRLRSDTVYPEDTLNFVGYGRSGDGVSGDIVEASFTVKRVGQNVADSYYSNDEHPFSLTEVFRFDFDFPPAATAGSVGGRRPSLGNHLETTLGGGDSGGPAFTKVNDALEFAGVMTYSFGGGSQPSPPFFGSGGGGMLIPAYRSWILEQVPEPGSAWLVWFGTLLLALFSGRWRTTCHV